MEKKDLGFWRFRRVCLLWATACTIMQLQCVLSLNEEGKLLLNWKQNYLEDVDNSLSNWNASDTSPCFWNGVQCTHGFVTVLDFSPLPFCHLVGNIHALTPSKFVNLTILNVGNTSLSGSFPEDIVNCSKLVYLNLSWTYIGGNFPNDITKLQHLQVFDLGFANFEGIVETKFDKLQELRVLCLGWNYFEGQMPKSILSLTKLEELTLSHNNWNGTLPLGFFTIPNLKVLWLGSDLDVLDMVPWPNVSLWKGLEDFRLHGVNFAPSLFPTMLLTLTKLRILNLERCHIIGSIPSLENLTHLEELNLSNNTLSGNIPNMFGSMPNLTILWLFSNQLTGPLPSSLFQCSKLREVIVFNNGLSGGLASLVDLQGSLTWLDIGVNNFSGVIPASVGNLTLLTFLGLGNNNLNGTIPSIWKSLSLLTSLDLSVNKLIGPIPPEIANLDRLTTLYLYRNQLTGEIPYDAGKNSLLEFVDLGSNLLGGPMPPYLCWGNNVSLQFLGLYENKLTGSIPDTYGSCMNLRVLRLDGNQLEGPMPVGLWGGTNLVRMQLSGNHLNGSMDANIGNAKSLSILLVQDNMFSGPIPDEIGQTNLVKFQAGSNKFNGTLPPMLGNLMSLTQLVLGANSFNGAIPSSLGKCSELFQLDLSKNHLDNTIPEELTNLKKLSILDVSENNLTGTINRGFFSMVNLQTLNVAFNNLSGVIPMEENGLTFITVNFTGNPHLCIEGSCGSNSSEVVLSSPGDGKRVWITVMGVISVGIVVLFVFLVFRRCKSTSSKDLDTVVNKDMWMLTFFSDKVFRDHEVTTLDEENLIGAGGSGKVYKVTLSNGETMAVKKLWNVSKEDSSKDHGFETEVRTLASLNHKHIVRLLCCCANRDSKLLVYEYMPQGSLGDILHGSKVEMLPWDIRYKIAVGAAMGLEFLHHECTPQILHRDIKSNNILLDLDYEAYLTDFGIAKLVETAASHTLSTIAGSLGYMAPEYSFSARVNEKIDVYSFGVVLLELVTGKRAIDPTICGEGGPNLVQWVHEKVQTAEGVYEILDPSCERSSQDDMIALLRIGMLCTSFVPARRPSMRNVVKLLADVAPRSSVISDVGKCGSEEGFDHDILL